MEKQMNELYHHGIKGQRWGIRRFQNKNGTLTAAGRKRYDSEETSGTDSAKNTKKRMSTKKKVAIGVGAAAVAGTLLAVYGKHKLSGSMRSVAYGSSYVSRIPIDRIAIPRVEVPRIEVPRVRL